MKQYQDGRGTRHMKATAFRYHRLEELKKLAFDKQTSLNSFLAKLCDKALEERGNE